MGPLILLGSGQKNEVWVMAGAKNISRGLGSVGTGAKKISRRLGPIGAGAKISS